MNYHIATAIFTSYISTLCQAQIIPTYELRLAADGTREYVPADPNLQSPQAGFRAYDNFRSPSFGGGQSLFRGYYRMGGSEIADDLQMATTSPSRLDLPPKN